MTQDEALTGYRPVTQFLEEDLSEELVNGLIQQAKTAPTQFHLQPTHYWTVSNKEIKKELSSACLNNQYIVNAPVVILLTASRFCDDEAIDQVLDQELEAQNISVAQVEAIERQVKMYFDVSPLGLGWIGKLFGAPILRLFTPMPQLACIHKREWLTRQVMRNATLLWHASLQAKIGAEFIDAFDEWRVKSALGIPWHHIVVSIIALGKTSSFGPKKTERPIEEVLHTNP